MHPLLLVRHASSRPLPGAPSNRWGLSADGVRAAMEVGDRLPDRTPAILAGTEPVTAQTARAIGSARGDRVEILLDDRLDEVRCPPGADLDDPDPLVRYLGGASPSGWEPHDEVTARVSAAVLDAQSDDLGATVLVTSGVALALWLAPRIGLDALTTWTRMGAPDVWSYDPLANRVAHLPHRVTSALGVSRATQLPRRLRTPSSMRGEPVAARTTDLRTPRSGQAVRG